MRKLLSAMLVIGLAASIAAPANATPASPTDPASLLLPEPVTVDTTGRVTIDPSLRTVTGPVTVVVRLKDAPLAVANGDGYLQAARAGAARATAAQQQAHLAQLSQAQSTFVGQANALGAREVARFSKALNGVAMTVDASQIGSLAALPGVVSVRPVRNYELDLSETVPYIGADPSVLPPGVDGAGIIVAVMDSGIDYTHVAFGGIGTTAAYTAAYGTSVTDPRTTTRDGLFPTAKVIEGIDFVGEVWPNGPETTDPDPIDCGPETIAAPCDGGHGSHVGDIIAGADGVAPGASLLAVKVCSAVSTSCSGVALLQGVDYILDPNGDGSMDDAVDVANLSLGSPYGQKEDDLSFALGNAARLGVVVVASAGNSADRPYIAGSPSTQPEIISVAQTTVPSDRSYLVTSSALANPVQAIAQPWAAAPILTSAPLAYITTNAATRLGCADAAGTNPFAPGSLAGLIVLVDRGTCAVSLKVSNIAAAGGIAAIVANNVSQGPNDPPPIFSFGGGNPNIPGYTVTLVGGTALKAIVGQTVTIDPAAAINITGSMIASSSRGPGYSFNAIKPEIGAPGASVSAEAGTGTGTTAFGGTSGSAPMVSGAAALVLDAHSDYSPRDVKAVLVTTAETTIYVNPGGPNPTELAPITRIGGGEVRANKAIDTSTAAWAADDDNPVLSFGFRAIAEDATFKKRVIVRNYSDTRRTYTITPSFRYDVDKTSGAVVPSAPTEITVPAHGTRSFVIELKVLADKLPVWGLNGGNRGGDGWRLQGQEFDGYLTIADAKDSIHLPWQILPRRSAEVEAETRNLKLSESDQLKLNNASAVQEGEVDVFTLTGTSKRISKDVLPGEGYNYAIIDLKAVGVRPMIIGGIPSVQFGIATNGLRSHPNYPAEFDIYVDVDRDPNDVDKFEYVLYNSELSGFAVSGQCVVNVLNLDTGLGAAYFYCDADLNSGNMIFTAPLSALGLTSASQFSFEVYAFDNYFSGNLTDVIWYMTTDLNEPRYYADASAVLVPASGSETLTIGQNEVYTEPTQTDGILLLYRNAQPGKESDVIRVR